ncbi:hypothetical protein [Amycolatopsis sp. WAC 01416]|nr:hypothetical protein [Amycolatopsis sp. WAC 01416]
MNLTEAPEQYLKALFEAVQLAIVVHDDGERGDQAPGRPAA